MFDKIECIENELLKNHTSFKIGGPCKFFVCPKNISELKKALSICKRNNLNYFILGNGTNLLVDDKGFDGVIISLKHFNKTKIRKYAGFTIVSLGPGVNLFNLNKTLLKSQISGLEWSYGIPGSVGGAVKMNAGAYEGQISDFLYEIKYLKNGKVHCQKNFKGDYRKGFDDGIILNVKFKLKKGNMVEIEEKMNNHLNLRKLNQPYDKPSAGSVFKRSNEIIPSKLIDEFGLKGMRIGDAMISKKHAGFIVNLGNATSEDVLKLIKLIKLIFKSQKIDLEEEIIYLH